MVNIKSLLTQILNALVLRTGATLTNELKCSNGAVIFGSGQIGEEAGLTITEFVNKVRYSSGAMGSVKINSSSAGGYTFSGWYNYFYIPHRFGADSGTVRASNNDNHSYGNIFLTAMTSLGNLYNLRISGNSIAEVNRFDTAPLTQSSSEPTPAQTSTTYYSMETSANRTNIRKTNRMVYITLGVTAKSPASWQAFANGFPVPMQAPVYGCLCCDTDFSTMSISIESDGSIKGAGGVANKLYYGTIYYVSAS